MAIRVSEGLVGCGGHTDLAGVSSFPMVSAGCWLGFAVRLCYRLERVARVFGPSVFGIAVWGHTGIKGGSAGLQGEPTIIHKMFETNLNSLRENLCIPCL